MEVLQSEEISVTKEQAKELIDLGVQLELDCDVEARAEIEGQLLAEELAELTESK